MWRMFYMLLLFSPLVTSSVYATSTPVSTPDLSCPSPLPDLDSMDPDYISQCRRCWPSASPYPVFPSYPTTSPMPTFSSSCIATPDLTATVPPSPTLGWATLDPAATLAFPTPSACGVGGGNATVTPLPAAATATPTLPPTPALGRYVWLDPSVVSFSTVGAVSPIDPIRGIWPMSPDTYFASTPARSDIRLDGWLYRVISSTMRGDYWFGPASYGGFVDVPTSFMCTISASHAADYCFGHPTSPYSNASPLMQPYSGAIYIGLSGYQWHGGFGGSWTYELQAILSSPNPPPNPTAAPSPTATLAAGFGLPTPVPDGLFDCSIPSYRDASPAVDLDFALSFGSVQRYVLLPAIDISVGGFDVPFLGWEVPVYSFQFAGFALDALPVSLPNPVILGFVFPFSELLLLSLAFFLVRSILSL
jgi:hypothetical protein